MKRTRFPCTLRLREDSPEPRAPPPRAEPPRLRPVCCSRPRSSLFSPSGVALMALRFRGAELRHRQEAVMAVPNGAVAKKCV